MFRPAPVICAGRESQPEQVFLDMEGLQTATVESRSESPEASAAPCACVELDRFCEGCAYNLRTLPVCCDEYTGIPVVRCPECGRFQPANDTSTAIRPWLHRLTSLLLAIWMLTLVTGLVCLGMAEGAMTYANLDELTVRAGSRIERVNNITIRTWSGSGPLEVQTDYPYRKLFIATMLITSSLIAFAGGALAVVVVPHWHRGAYFGLMLAVPVVVGMLVAIIWRYEAPHLLDWGLLHVMAHTGVQVLGGLLGVIFGRPLARLTVRIFLPSGVRPSLAFLWLADNKPFPRPSA